VQTVYTCLAGQSVCAYYQPGNPPAGSGALGSPPTGSNPLPTSSLGSNSGASALSGPASSITDVLGAVAGQGGTGAGG
jgi:hypothetical protein